MSLAQARSGPRRRGEVPGRVHRTLAKLLRCCAPFGLLGISCAEPHPLAPEQRSGAEVGDWHTWVAAPGDMPGVAAPASDSSASARQERDEIVRLQATPDAVRDSLIRFWDGDPSSSWTRVAVDRLDFYWPLLPDVRHATPVRAARVMALLHVAMHDALVTTWRAKYAYGRRAPAVSDGRIRRLVRPEAVPSYPSEHAAIAAVASLLLAHLLPLEDSAALAARARRAAESRIAAGAAYRSDVDAGWSIGREVARRVIERARGDGAAQEWTGEVPTGPDRWRPTPPRRVQRPFDPLAGTWRTWVLPRGDALRLPPPPTPSSSRFMVDLAELRGLAGGARTEHQVARARYWATDAPSLRWELFVDDELRQRRWSVPHAAQARAWVSVAIHDAAIACWDSKYAHWLARPVTMDSTLTTVFSTPPFPSYPSGHSTMSTAAAVMMETLFPDAAAKYHALAEEASVSRVWGGVHYRFDVIDGDSLGARVGRVVQGMWRTRR